MSSTRFDLLPFSGGPRHCVGKYLAEFEMRLVLPMIMQQFQLLLEEGYSAVPEALVTLRPAERMMVTAYAHRVGHA